MRVAMGGSSSCSSKRESGEEERCIRQCVTKVIGLFSGLEYEEPDSRNSSLFPLFPISFSTYYKINLHSHVRQLSQTGCVPLILFSRAHQLTLTLQGLRIASRSSGKSSRLLWTFSPLRAARAFSTIPARVPRTNVVGALALGTAVAGYTLYESTSRVLSLEKS